MGPSTRSAQRALLLQLPEVASEMARLIDSGSTLRQAVTEIADSYQGPVADAFGVVVAELEAGATLDRALDFWASSSEHIGVNMLVLACRIGSAQGGNLAAALEGVSGALSDSIEVSEEARALTSQARTSALVLMGLPAFGLGLFSMLDRSIPIFLVSTTMGLVLLLMGVLLDLAGAFVMVRMLRWSLR